MRYTIRDSRGVQVGESNAIQKASDLACATICADNPAAQLVDSDTAMAFRFTVYQRDDYLSGFVGTQYKTEDEAFRAITEILKRS